MTSKGKGGRRYLPYAEFYLKELDILTKEEGIEYQLIAIYDDKMNKREYRWSTQPKLDEVPDSIDKFLILTYNNITNTCKTTTQSIVKEESLWQNRY